MSSHICLQKTKHHVITFAVREGKSGLCGHVVFSGRGLRLHPPPAPLSLISLQSSARCSLQHASASSRKVRAGMLQLTTMPAASALANVLQLTVSAAYTRPNTLQFTLSAASAQPKMLQFALYLLP